jgi:hypothetical protein
MKHASKWLTPLITDQNQRFLPFLKANGNNKITEVHINEYFKCFSIGWYLRSKIESKICTHVNPYTIRCYRVVQMFLQNFIGDFW